MKYAKLDEECVQDERDYRNYKISLVLGQVAAAWALRPEEGTLNTILSISVFCSVIYLAFEVLRMRLNLNHMHYILDRAYETHPKNAPSSLYESDISGSSAKTCWGQMSLALNNLNHFLIIVSFFSFLLGSFQSLRN